MTQHAPTLKEIFRDHNNYQVDKYFHYLSVYEELFSDKRQSPIQLLELGVQNGGSLEVWKSYFFHPDTRITGIDIEEAVCELSFELGIETYCFDLSSFQTLMNWIPSRSFDTIIDDASHYSEHVVLNFVILFQVLKPGGIYVVEDVHASYWSAFHGGLKMSHRIEDQMKISTVEFFKVLIDVIHVHSIDPNDAEIWNREVLSVIDHDMMRYLSDWIKSIRFEDSMIVVIKNSEPRSRFPFRMQSGRLTPVKNSTEELLKINARQLLK
jgi:SAM-dependent methyltransferase